MKTRQFLSTIVGLFLFIAISCKKDEVVAPKSPDKAVTSFALNGLSPAVVGVIDGVNITLTVPLNTNVSALVPTIAVSPKATVSPATGLPQNFTNPVTYTVTAEDATTQMYTVSVVINPPKITTFAPDNGVAGTSVVLNGEGFSDISTDIKVTINGKTANITASNTKQITVQIPEKAGTGEIVVDVKGKQAKTATAFKYKYTATSTTLFSYPSSLYQSVVVDPDDGTVYATDRKYSVLWILRPNASSYQAITLKDASNVIHASLTGITILKTGLGGANDKLLVVTNEAKGVFAYRISDITTSTTTATLWAIILSNDAIYNAPTSVIAVPDSPTASYLTNATYYFACFGNSSIVRSNRKNGVTSSPSIVGAGTGFNTGTVASTNAKFSGPVGIYLKNNLVYVADEGNHAIRVVDYDNAKVTTLFGTGTAGNVDGNFADVKLNLPANVVVDDAGLVYVTDRGNNSLRVFDTRNQTSQTLLTGLNSPYGLAIDKTGSFLYVGEWGTGTNKVIKVAIK
jgi:sugar lactone lactonase YvrE